MRFRAILLALSLTLTSLSHAESGPTDDRVTDQVRIKLAGDQVVKGGAIDVTVSDGKVTLKGKVEKEEQKRKAERLTKKVKGVKSVDNQLTVGPHV